MGRDILPLTLDRLADLPSACAGCTFWELDPVVAGRTCASETAQAKEDWLTAVLLEWGSPGRVAYVDGQPAGYLTFAPAHLVPRAQAFPTSPVSGDAVVLMTGRIDQRFSGQGLGRVLAQAAAKDGLRRGVRAFEAYGTSGRPRRGSECVLPSDFLRAVGFKTAREHPSYPRLRLDLRSVVRWREGVEQAVERLFAPVRGLGAPQPVGAAHLEEHG